MRVPTALAAVLVLAACGSTPVRDGPPPPRDGDSDRVAVDSGTQAPPLPDSPLAAVDPDAGRPVFPVVATDAPGARPTEDRALYRIGDREVRLSDLGVFLLAYFPDRAGDALTQLLDEALAEAEARREGVSVPAEAVAREADAYIDERRRQVRLDYGAEAELEDVLSRRYGRSMETYRKDAMRLARTRLLIDRLVRLAERRSDRVAVRVLVFDDAGRAADAAVRLREGADLTLLARAEGLRPPASPPALARDEFDDPDLASKLFDATAGDYIGPVPFRTPAAPDRTFHQVLRVVRHLPGTDRPWAELRDEIERELDGAAGTPPRAYLRWKRAVLERHRVDVRDAARGFVPWTHAGGGEAERR